MNKKLISVCICTHAPDLKLLARVLEALSRQTLDSHLWEVLLIENASEATIDVSILSSLPCESTLMLEGTPGKVHAMVAGAKTASGEWIVFVDDDNILAPDYLTNLLKLSGVHPKIGVFSASIDGEFEVEVPDWSKPYLIYLAIRKVTTPKWANCHPAPVGPIGAGMCVRKGILQSFVDVYDSGKIGAGLTRTKGDLFGGADDTLFMELAFDAGYGCGAFPDLRHTHVIPAVRLELDYLKRLVHDLTASHTVLGARMGAVKPSRIKSRIRLILSLLSCLKIPSPEKRAIEMAKHRGRYKGILAILNQK